MLNTKSKKNSHLFFYLIAALSMSACGGGGGGGNDNTEPELATPSAINGITTFNQTIAANDGESSAAPGQANYWDIDGDFAINDGNDDQFDGGLVLSIAITGSLTGSLDFPFDQLESELSFSSPELGSSEGIITASVSDINPVAGTYSAHLHGTHESRMQQTLDLTTALTPITLTWAGDSNFKAGKMEEIDIPSFYDVVIRDQNGAVVSVFRNENFSGITGIFGTADLTAFQGQIVQLSFESRSQGNSIRVDSVSVTDGGVTEFITNGDFETGDLSSWTNNDLVTVQNITSGVRNLDGIDVSRSFFTVPNKTWGRWVDTFTNTSNADVTVTVTYDTFLGSDGRGIIYATANTNNQGLTTWDGSISNRDRDIGFAFGAADSINFVSDDGLGNNNGSGTLNWSYNVTIPAAGTVAIVNFVVMNGTDTADTAADITARATEIDIDVAAIINGYGSDGQYQDGMTQAQIDAVVNMQ